MTLLPQPTILGLPGLTLIASYGFIVALLVLL